MLTLDQYKTACRIRALQAWRMLTTRRFAWHCRLQFPVAPLAAVQFVGAFHVLRIRSVNEVSCRHTD